MAIPVSQQLVCSCGSSFFYTVRAEQFQAGGYGTAEFRSTSGAPKTLLICLCGKPVPPQPAHYSRGTSADLAETAFRASIKCADKLRSEVTMAHVAEIAASPAEVKELREGVEEIRKAMNAAAEPKAPQPKERKPSKTKMSHAAVGTGV
jgi:hypothetical protein